LWFHNPYALDFIERDLVGAPILGLGSADADVIGHAGGLFERAIALQIKRNSRRAEVIADLVPMRWRSRRASIR
jgi:hypothetical protein